MKQLLVIFILCIAIKSSAQITITGKIVSDKGFPIVFAETSILNHDSTELETMLTDSLGRFHFSIYKPNFIIVIKKYNTILFSKPFFQVKDSLSLGVLKINDTRTLKGAIITTRKKTIERKMDRLVFNVENSINTVSSDALEVLKITPGIKVQNEKIKMVGKSKLSVMIDGRIIQLTDEELANFLKSISSDDIKSIEVITTPPAKYDAQGNSGLVNIILKRSRKNSWSALLGSSYLQRTFADNSINGNFNYNKKKLTLSTGFLLKKGGKYGQQDDYAYYDNETWHTNQPYYSNYKRANGAFSLDYQMNTKNSFGISYLLNASNSKGHDSPYSNVYEKGTSHLISNLQSKGNGSYSPNIQAINFHDDYMIDTLGRKCLINIDYFTYKNKDDKKYQGTMMNEFPTSAKFFIGQNINFQDVKNNSYKVDFEWPSKHVDLNFGAKFSNSISTNDISFYNSGLTDTLSQILELDKNDFKYSEKVLAGYTSGTKKINSKLEAQIGLRVEATFTNSFSKNKNISANNDYVKLYPTAYLSYSANDNNTLALNYSRRIDRPTFSDLNPNIYFINPFQSIEGNSFLQPAFIDNVELVFTHKKLDSKLYYSFENNLFAQVPDANPNTFYINYTNKNYIDANRIGLSETYSYEKIKWLNSISTFDISYAVLKSDLTSTIKYQKGINSRFTTNNDISLNKRKTSLLNINFWYNFPEIDGIYKLKNKSNLSLSFQQLFYDKKLKLTLKGNDIFRKEIDNQTTRVNGVFQNGIYYEDVRSMQFSIIYKFGNKRIKKIDREIGNEEERNRAGY